MHFQLVLIMNMQGCHHWWECDRLFLLPPSPRTNLSPSGTLPSQPGNVSTDLLYFSRYQPLTHSVSDRFWGVLFELGPLTYSHFLKRTASPSFLLIWLPSLRICVNWGQPIVKENLVLGSLLHSCFGRWVSELSWAARWLGETV